MSNLKVLDCSLRDGGYINNWNFGIENSKTLISRLEKANLDYIEIGFLTVEKSSDNQSLFDSFQKIRNFLPENCSKDKLFGMITFSKFPSELVPKVENSPICGLRVIFKKYQQKDALEYCRQIKKKGYKLFINPTYTNQYSDLELISLLKEIQNIKPYAVSIVDSMGVMKETDVLRIFRIFDENLSEDISVCFHSHNNLLLSFPNARCLIKKVHSRELIIDSTVFGIGRGAGNLCTELITQYINDNFEGHYDLIPVLKVLDEQINPIFLENPWGYSSLYYLAAKNYCHQNYAKYLSDKKINSLTLADKILNSIPEDKKSSYDENLIEKIYLKEENISSSTNAQIM